MSLPDRLFAADGVAYTYAEFYRWYGADAEQMWQGAAATEHLGRRLAGNDVRRRIAADGTAYTYTDFANWYGNDAGQLWERAAATAVDNSDDAVWNIRSKHRHAGLAAAYRSRDVVTMLIMTSTGELPVDDSLVPPDPDDRRVSKRDWELSVRAWRFAIKNFIR